MDSEIEKIKEIQEEMIAARRFAKTGQNDPEHSELDSEYLHPDGRTLKVFFILHTFSEKTVPKKLINARLRDGMDFDEIVFVTCLDINPNTKKNLDAVRGKRIQCFTFAELAVNLVKHKLVRKHSKVPDSELRVLKIKREELPAILSSDPIVKYNGWRKGDVVKILTDNNFCEYFGMYMNYRLVR